MILTNPAMSWWYPKIILQVTKYHNSNILARLTDNPFSVSEKEGLKIINNS